MNELLQTGICPNCLIERTWPADQDAHCMSDAEWEAFIEARVDAHKQGTCDPKTCASCLYPGDALERWLS